MKNKKIRRFIIISLSVIGLIFGLNLLNRAIALDVNREPSSGKIQIVTSRPKDVSRELPCESLQNVANRGVEVEHIGDYQHESGLFQMWLYQDENLGIPVTNVTKVTNQDICVLAYSQYDEAITNRVPLEVARSLTLQLHQKLADISGGVEAYKANFLASVNDEGEGYDFDPSTPGNNDSNRDQTIEINSVDKWALEQLGIALPEGRFRVIDIDDAWQYD
ncbi:MAG: hypothetical protein WA947_08460 [Phormidesmis sp.]